MGISFPFLAAPPPAVLRGEASLEETLRDAVSRNAHPTLAEALLRHLPADRSVERVYIGNETCERLLPTPQAIGSWAAAARGGRVALSLVLPPLSRDGLAKAESRGPGAGRRGGRGGRRRRLGDGPSPAVPPPGARHRPGPPDAQDAARPTARGPLRFAAGPPARAVGALPLRGARARFPGVDGAVRDRAPGDRPVPAAAGRGRVGRPGGTVVGPPAVPVRDDGDGGAFRRRCTRREKEGSSRAARAGTSARSTPSSSVSPSRGETGRGGTCWPSGTPSITPCRRMSWRGCWPAFPPGRAWTGSSSPSRRRRGSRRDEDHRSDQPPGRGGDARRGRGGGVLLRVRPAGVARAVRGGVLAEPPRPRGGEPPPARRRFPAGGTVARARHPGVRDVQRPVLHPGAAGISSSRSSIGSRRSPGSTASSSPTSGSSWSCGAPCRSFPSTRAP